MNYSVSDTAEYGGLVKGRKLITSETKNVMKEILTDIQTGKFAEEWIEENKQGQPLLNKLRKESEEHQIEKVGAKLREMMSWLKK